MRKMKTQSGAFIATGMLLLYQFMLTIRTRMKL